MYNIYMSRVVVVRFLRDDSQNRLEQKQYHKMLDFALKELVNAENCPAAFKKILRGQVIGMKTNCLARKLNSTPVALAEALSDLLIKSGFAENNLIIWERSNRELRDAGFELNASSFGKRCFGTDSNGVGYSTDFYSYGKVDSLASRIITEKVDSNINLALLKDHSIAGLSGALKNMYGAINNPNKYHIPNCDPYAAHISNLQPIRDKNRLTLIDAVRIQYHAGPGYDSRYLEYYGGLIASVDPVAGDRVALEILQHIRKQNRLVPLEEDRRPVKYLESAESIGLGVADMNKIEIKVFEMDSDGNTKAGVLL
jgi:uncharacterized protein (DUF362 family)